MAVKHIPGAPYVNQSEKDACEYLLARLRGIPDADWYLLTNIAHSAHDSQAADEIDIVAVGPSGVHVIEVKHWDSAYLKRNPEGVVDAEADKLERKARRLKGAIQQHLHVDVGFIAGKLLLTKGQGERYKQGTQRKSIRGIPVFALAEWSELLSTQDQPLLTPEAAFIVAKQLEPRFKDPCGHKVRTFGDFIDMEPYPGVDDAFHRVYRARRRPGRERVILHLYDLSATDEKNGLDIARREFDALQRYQKSPFLPSLMDSFQEATFYPGEIYFFSYVDTEAATLEARSKDSDWSVQDRVRLARRCLEALLTLHEPGGDTPPILHRNLNPQTIRVRSNGEPVLTGLHAARLPGAISVGPILPPVPEDVKPFVAPEVLASGWTASSAASDVFALCSSLVASLSAFAGDSAADKTSALLRRGLAADPGDREPLKRLIEEFDTEQSPKREPQPIPTQYWDADTKLEFRDRYYKVVTRLGRGGAGSTFKVVEVDRQGDEERSGPYVAKSITNSDLGQAATNAYARVRAHTGGPHLAGVLEVASEWRDNQISALLRWVEGEPLSDWLGVVPLYFEELGERDREAMALTWLRDICQALAALHQAGLVHGDVSPRNLIVQGHEITLTDYDLVTAVGERVRGGTPDYSSKKPGDSIALADDIFATAASIFHALFGRAPFLHGASTDKGRGLAWADADRPAWPKVAAFLDEATAPDPSNRFESAMAAISFLDELRVPATPAQARIPAAPAPIVWSANRVEWLRYLQQSFPGSPKGNVETRGLDSGFAKDTYVETGFDRQLADDVQAGRVSLIVLCGNAGDGKTALLQNLARRLGLDAGPSSQRLWDFTLPSGTRIRANLDGSAAFRGKTAEELLDEFFGPFSSWPYPPALVHLVAINDGPLVAWLNRAADGHLKEQLLSALGLGRSVDADPRVLFVDLNARSLVGGLTVDGALSLGFVHELLEKMLGPNSSTWSACDTCSAQDRCHVRQSVQTLRDSELGPRVRAKLTQALQAVHQRGEFHITARSLKATLAYVFFGTDDCDDLHSDPRLAPTAYSERAFSALVPYRQGELLQELRLLDPGLDSHPRIDAELLTGIDPSETPEALPSRLASLRRRAYFEWADSKILQIAGTKDALPLARGRHLSTFMAVATGNDQERRRIRDGLCEGLARLEDLPPVALVQGSVPLKIQGRTPTETAFWVAKPTDRFVLQADLPTVVGGLERLHTHVILKYRYNDGREESLLIGADLFHLLMELKDGYQLSDVRSDEVFAQLSIFQQRLAQEDDSRQYAWNPLDGSLFEISTRFEDGLNNIVIESQAR